MELAICGTSNAKLLKGGFKSFATMKLYHHVKPWIRSHRQEFQDNMMGG
jgi:hypothetical protein